jgi:toxin ParE1/3/4
MKPFELSPRADRRLEQISDFTRERFGSKQAAKYVKSLLNSCRRIAQGHAATRSCHDVFAANLRSDLRFARGERHFIVFTESPTVVLIVDFIHQSSDFAKRLETPE